MLSWTANSINGLTKIEQKLDRNDQAIKRALALIAARMDKEG